MKKTPRWIIALALITVVSFAVSGLQAGALLLAQRVIPTTSTVKTVNLQVYQDSGMANVLTSLNWSNVAPIGPMELGQTKTVTVYLWSTSNTPTTLNMTTSNYWPSGVQQYLTVSWNKEGQVLQPNTPTAAEISLNLSPSVSNVTEFSFDITLIARG
jgi:hypothetical protein